MDITAKKIIAIVQARLGSSRLPEKVLRQVNGQPLLDILLKRLSTATNLTQIVVAIPDGPKEDRLANHIENLGFCLYRGSEHNVLDRFYQAALHWQADIIVRITADCPLVDAQLVDQVIAKHCESEADYSSNVCPATYPDGLDVEVFNFSCLARANAEAKTAVELEHVTPYLRKKPFKQSQVSSSIDYSQHRWTVDEAADLQVVSNIIQHFQPNLLFSWQEVVQLYEQQPQLFAANQHIKRNSGAQQITGQKLWQRAQQVILGGNMLLSKNPDQFLPQQWPAYYSKAKGCQVWDLDGNSYYDLSVMGVGTNILGYGHDEVDAAVHRAVKQGNLCTLNCPEEVLLAEQLLQLHSWAAKVKFARSGGEANAIAIRIARAAVGRDEIAVCGYHGWHDWYLAGNLQCKTSLDEHLMPDLAVKGVPKKLKNTIHPFSYNDFSQLERLLAENDNIGIIKMEVMRNIPPQNDFLQKVRRLASEKNLILIFDECTSGFRETLGGLHLKYGVTPDLAVFGKTLGNGYAITAVIGVEKVMQAAEQTFISSTFWSERIGPAAALKSLQIMKETQAYQVISQKGQYIKEKWQQLALKYELDMHISGLDALCSFYFKDEKMPEYKTLISQEMLKQGFLAATSLYLSVAHSEEIIAKYLLALEKVFVKIKDCQQGEDVYQLLQGPVCLSGMKRMN